MRGCSLALLAGLLVACRSQPAPPSGAPSASAPAASASAPTETPRQRLAFQSPGSQSKYLDPQIVQAQGMLRKLPSKTDAWVTLGRLWAQKARETADPGYFLNADACADEALTIEPRSSLALGLKAQVALNDHRFTDALDLAERALAIDPNDLVALSVKSDALLELGRFEESVKSTQQMMDLKPNMAAYTRTSYLRWLQGDFAGAKQAAFSAASSGRSTKDPEPHAWTLVQAAMLFWHVGDYEGADAGFDKALESVADYAPALVGKGRVALALGKARDAVGFLERADARSPLVETAWLLGDARAAAGDADGATKAYDEVVRRGRLHDPRTLSLFLSTKKRDPDEALRLAQSEQKKRNDLYTEDALGWALYRAGKLPEARAALDHANRLGTRDATLMFHLGAVKLAQNDKAAGEKLLREALKLNPKFDPTAAQEASELLSGKKK